jgi:hypothetical protein
MTVFDVVPPPTGASDLYLKPATFLSARHRSEGQGRCGHGQHSGPGHPGCAERALRGAGLADDSVLVPRRDEDQIIPPSVQRSMAEHAGSSIVEFTAEPPRAGL